MLHPSRVEAFPSQGRPENLDDLASTIMPPDIEFTGASIPPDVMERTATDRRLPLAGLAGPGITATARTADRSPQQG